MLKLTKSRNFEYQNSNIYSYQLLKAKQHFKVNFNEPSIVHPRHKKLHSLGEPFFAKRSESFRDNECSMANQLFKSVET